MEPLRDSRSLGALLTDLSHNLSTLFRQEIALARAEVSEKLHQAGAGVALLAAGAMIILIGLFFLAQALVFGLVALLEIWLPAEIAVWLGPLLVGIAAGVLAWSLLARGRRQLRAERLAPQRTVESLREDAALARQQLR